MSDTGQDNHAAILLMLLDEEQAAAIVSELNSDEVERLGTAMVQLSEVATLDAETALERFVHAARAQGAIGVDGEARARTVFAKALGKGRSELVIEKVAPDSRTAKFPQLANMTDEQIFGVLESLDAQPCAMLIADLEPWRAAALLAKLPASLQEDIVSRVARSALPSPLAISAVSALLNERIERRSPSAVKPATRVAATAAILNRMKQPEHQTLLRSIGKKDKQLAEAIAEQMFVFSDVPRLPSKDLGQVMRAIDAEVLVLALKGVAPSTRELMLGTLSQRAAQALRDEIDERGPVPAADVEIAQKQIITTIKALEKAGTLKLGGGEDLV